jgi:hypothetical protein
MAGFLFGLECVSEQCRVVLQEEAYQHRSHLRKESGRPCLLVLLWVLLGKVVGTVGAGYLCRTSTEYLGKDLVE